MRRTPTETLMAALGECETATEVMIIMVHGDAISWHCEEVSFYRQLGILDFVTECVREDVRKTKEDTDGNK